MAGGVGANNSVGTYAFKLQQSISRMKNKDVLGQLFVLDPALSDKALKAFENDKALEILHLPQVRSRTAISSD